MIRSAGKDNERIFLLQANALAVAVKVAAAVVLPCAGMRDVAIGNGLNRDNSLILLWSARSCVAVRSLG